MTSRKLFVVGVLVLALALSAMAPAGATVGTKSLSAHVHSAITSPTANDSITDGTFLMLSDNGKGYWVVNTFACYALANPPKKAVTTELRYCYLQVDRKDVFDATIVPLWKGLTVGIGAAKKKVPVDPPGVLTQCISSITTFKDGSVVKKNLALSADGFTPEVCIHKV